MTTDRNANLQRIYRAALIMAVCEWFGCSMDEQQYKTVAASFGLHMSNLPTDAYLPALMWQYAVEETPGNPSRSPCLAAQTAFTNWAKIEQELAVYHLNIDVLLTEDGTS